MRTTPANKHAIEAVLEGRPNLDPLLSAVRTRNEDFARFLIKNGADPVPISISTALRSRETAAKQS